MNSTWSQDKFIKAFKFAAQAHLGQPLPGADLPYLLHIGLVCMEVMASLQVESMEDPDLALQCAALHDVVEDTSVSLDTIREEFGSDVAEGVDALTKKKDAAFSVSKYLRKINSISKEAAIVKLADRITNLQPPPSTWTKEKTKTYWEESKLIWKTLKCNSSYLSARLEQKIAEYEKFIK